MIRGISGNIVDVDDDNRLHVVATTETELEYASEKQGKAYSISSDYTTAGADEEVIYIQNTSSTDDFIIDEIFLGGSVTHKFTLADVSGTPGGAADITVKNLNLGSGNSADMVARGDASVTGLTVGDTMVLGRSMANDSKEIPVMGAIVLGQDDAVAVTASGTGEVNVTVVGHYKTRS